MNPGFREIRHAVQRDGSKKIQASPLIGNAQAVSLTIKTPEGPKMGETMLMPRHEQPPVVKNQQAVPVDDSILRGNNPVQTQRGSMGGPTSFLENVVKVVGLGNPTLGTMPQKQVSPGAPHGVFPSKELGQAAPAPEPAPYVPATCPGAVEMPDGRIIDPEDVIKLQDLCELMPFLLESYGALMAEKAKASGQLAPGQTVPIVGQQRTGAGAVPSTASQFGPAAGPGGPFAHGGGGFIASGGGVGPTGAQGQQGIQGPPGPGGILEPTIVKTDGDFIAGPGAFVAVPGTSIMFTQNQTGPAFFYLTASLGVTSGVPSLSQSGQIGLRIDGTDYPLASRLLHTFVGGVEEFILGQTVMLALALPAGPHTVEVVLRGLAPGEFGGMGLGTTLGVAASPTQPLYLAVSHN